MRRAGEVTYTDAHVRSGEGRGEVCFKDRKGLYRAMKKLQKAKLAGKRIKLKIVVSELWRFEVFCILGLKIRNEFFS